MILLPRTVEVIEKFSFGKKSSVKFQAIRYACGEKKKITGGDKPGKYTKKPQPKPPR
jgi:hypothetical protein